MFTELITRTPYTGRGVAELYKNVTESGWGNVIDFTLVCPDVTMISTLRAIVFPRLTQSNILSLACARGRLPQLRENSFGICTTCGTTAIQLAQKELEASGFVSLTDLSKFCARVGEAWFYRNDKTNASVILVADNSARGTIDVKLSHLIQSLLPRILPQIFIDNPLTDLEKELLKSLTTTDATTYKNTLDKLAEVQCLDGKIQATMLSKIGTGRLERMLKRCLDERQRAESSLSVILEQYGSLCAQIEDLKIRQSGIQFKIQEGDTDMEEFISYVKANKHVRITSVDDDFIEFVTTSILENYDPDLAEKMCDNERSYLYTGYMLFEDNEIFKPIENRKKFFKAIFSDNPKLKIKMCMCLRVDLRRCMVEAISRKGSYASYGSRYDDYIVNPHIDQHRCLGDNRRYIEEAARNGDYIGIVEQSISATGNINLSEGSVTVAPFISELLSSDRNIIRLPDGTDYTPTQAIEWLLKEEETNVQTNQDN